jgi:hypothetical protein
MDGDYATARFHSPLGLSYAGEGALIPLEPTQPACCQSLTSPYRRQAVRGRQRESLHSLREAGRGAGGDRGRNRFARRPSPVPATNANADLSLRAGQRGYERQGGGRALEWSLSNPWDVASHGHDLYIAMAGTHQIWKYNEQSTPQYLLINLFIYFLSIRIKYD